MHCRNAATCYRDIHETRSEALGYLAFSLFKLTLSQKAFSSFGVGAELVCLWVELLLVAYSGANSLRSHTMAQLLRGPWLRV